MKKVKFIDEHSEHEIVDVLYRDFYKVFFKVITYLEEIDNEEPPTDKEIVEILQRDFPNINEQILEYLDELANLNHPH
jgi:hypothetical protein